MKSKALYLIYIFPILFLLSLAACDNMDDYSSDPKHTLWFSQDTLRMDTVLTGIPTSTRQLKVYNPHKKALLISSIILADAGKSGFRINVDGIRGDQFSDIEIAGEDSLYIFVEATLPQQDNADIRLIKDSILFQLNGIRQEVKLRAYAQDAFTFRGKVIEKDTLIASQRPILIYDSISVAPDAHLTLVPACISMARLECRYTDAYQWQAAYPPRSFSGEIAPTVCSLIFLTTGYRDNGAAYDSTRPVTRIILFMQTFMEEVSVSAVTLR